MGSPSSDPVEVTIYTTQVCPYCHAAKQLLRRRGISFKEVDVTGDESRRQWLREMTGRPTVPQIFLGSKAVGGFDDLAALDRSGSLATRLLEDTRDTSAALAPTTEANPS